MTLSSYHAECMGALVIVYLLNRLQAYLQLPAITTVEHYCDNKGLVTQANCLMASAPDWWWHNVTDANLLAEFAHRAAGIQYVFEWERGHPERSRKDPKDYTPSEWGNVIADGLALKVWDSPDARNSS